MCTSQLRAYMTIVLGTLGIVTWFDPLTMRWCKPFTIDAIVTGKNVNYHRLLSNVQWFNSAKINPHQVRDASSSYFKILSILCKCTETMQGKFSKILYRLKWLRCTFGWIGWRDVDGLVCRDQLMRDRGAVSHVSRDHWPAADMSSTVTRWARVSPIPVTTSKCQDTGDITLKWTQVTRNTYVDILIALHWHARRWVAKCFQKIIKSGT